MTKEELFSRTRVFLIDLDGTVCLGETPLAGAAEALSAMRRAGKRVIFLTNNSSKTEEEYREKLSRLGLWGEDLVYTSGRAAVEILKRKHPGKRVYLLAPEAVKEEFLRAGILLDGEDPELLLLAYDTELTFEKIKRFDFFLRCGLPYFATHPDDVCPTAEGSMPDVGSFLALFARSSGRTPDEIFGKPCPAMGECVSRLTGARAEEMCMIGDRMHTDVRFANNCGMMSVLVLSGETTRENMHRFPDRPDLVLSSIAELGNCLRPRVLRV